MGSLPVSIIESPAWWPIHLGECAGGDVYDYLADAFQTSDSEMKRVWDDELHLENTRGPWPQFSFSVSGHTLSVVYFGNPRHQVEFRHTAFGGASTVWSTTGVDFVRPGFRWAEVETFSRLTESPTEITLLLLLPAVDIQREEHELAKDRLHKCFAAQGYSGRLISRFVDEAIKGLTYNAKWHYDTEFGWLTNRESSWRCRHRSQQGLSNRSDESFKELKLLTDILESHK